MSIVAHKYTPSEMSAHELESTFAARQHTVDYLLKSLRDQIRSSTLSSFVITGPRGAGKSTVIHMVALRIRQDAELSAAWIPVVFPEEQFNITSLRDLLATTLEVLVKDNVPAAQEWLEKVQAEPNEEQSEQLAVTGLREVTRLTRKRLVLFIENLDQLLEQNLDDQMKGTLRRLLMAEPFTMIIGSTVHVFDALKRYDEAFFNYFGQVPLSRLDAEQVSELLRKRAEFDKNERFLRELPKQQAKVRTLVHLTGGNPRFVLMLYELLSLRQVTTIVQHLRRLVDELTPLLKDEMENLPPQQRKVIHALMERGGTAQPTDLAGPTRLPLNAITTQLKRLKDAQIVEVLGGGKGKAANYTVPDKLFSIWYQMRYLNQNRRRIELFVEVLRVWFEEDERIETLRKLAQQRQEAAPQALRDCAMTAEYYAASLRGTLHERAAAELCVNQWVNTDLREAALVYADLSSGGKSQVQYDELTAQLNLSEWLCNRGDLGHAIDVLNEVVSKPGVSPDELTMALVNRGVARRRRGDPQGAMADYTTVIQLEGASKEAVARALFNRGATKGQLGDAQGAMADYTAVIQLEGAPKEQVAMALFNRGVTKRQVSNAQGAMADYTTVIQLEGAPKEEVVRALVNRGAEKSQLGDAQGAMADYTAVIQLEGAPKEAVARALVNCGVVKRQLGDTQGAMADCTAAIQLEGAPKEQVVRALVNRGATKGQLGDAQGAMADYSAVIQMEGVPKELVAMSLFNRGLARLERNQAANAMSDLLEVVDSGVTTKNLMSDAAAVSFSARLHGNDIARTEDVLRKFSAALEKLSNEQAREMALRFLNAVASPGMKEAWPIAWRSLAAKLNPEAAEAIRFLEPVCNVLEGKDRTLLNALPPEQREFAVEVLAKFEPKPKTEQAKLQE